MSNALAFVGLQTCNGLNIYIDLVIEVCYVAASRCGGSNVGCFIVVIRCQEALTGVQRAVGDIVAMVVTALALALSAWCWRWRWRLRRESGVCQGGVPLALIKSLNNWKPKRDSGTKRIYRAGEKRKMKGKKEKEDKKGRKEECLKK